MQRKIRITEYVDKKRNNDKTRKLSNTLASRHHKTRKLASRRQIQITPPQEKWTKVTKNEIVIFNKQFHLIVYGKMHVYLDNSYTN
jgi:hypothetical protein